MIKIKKMHLFNFNSKLIEDYTSYCVYLAHVLNYLYNYQVYEIVYKDNLQQIHSLVKVEEDMYMDVMGLWSRQEIIDYWNIKAYEPVNLILEDENSTHYDSDFINKMEDPQYYDKNYKKSILLNKHRDDTKSLAIQLYEKLSRL